MLSSRRIAQLVLSAASLTLVTSVTVLIAGAADQSRSSENASASTFANSAHVAPLASAQLENASTLRIASSK